MPALECHSKRMDGASLYESRHTLLPKPRRRRSDMQRGPRVQGHLSSSIQRTYRRLLPAPFIFSDVGTQDRPAALMPSKRLHRAIDKTIQSPWFPCTTRIHAHPANRQARGRHRRGHHLRPSSSEAILESHTFHDRTSCSHIPLSLRITIVRVKLAAACPILHRRVSAGCVRLPTSHLRTSQYGKVEPHLPVSHPRVGTALNGTSPGSVGASPCST